MKYTEKLKTLRLTKISGTNDVPVVYLTNLDGNIQTWADGNFSSIEEDGILYKMYMIYIDGVQDIRNNDFIETVDGDKYKVRGVSKYDTDFTKNTQIEALLPLKLG